MRAVKIAAAVMAVLIVLGTTVLVITVAKRLSAPAAPVVTAMAAAAVDEPAGTTIAGIAAVGDRLAVQLRGGGPDRVVFIDPHTATVVGRISLGR
jgi:hypothetical protein